VPAPPSAIVPDRDQLFKEFASLVKRLIREYGRDAEQRQDLAGEIYCQFCTLLDVYDPQRGVPLRPYIVRQLTFAVHTYTRQQRRVRSREVTLGNVEGGMNPTPIEDPTPSWVHALSQQQVTEALPEALSFLPARQRSVVIWRYYEERSFDEIAGMLNVQPSTARSLLRHGLTNLRKHIENAHR
jgi:RNA polymerase sigma factor (sigma-70 family)